MIWIEVGIIYFIVSGIVLRNLLALFAQAGEQLRR